MFVILSCANRANYRPASLIDIFNQKKEVRTLWWKGKVKIKTSKDEISGNVLIVAKKNPLLVRIEVTNWISGTILYGFIKERDFLFISPKEKRVYLGEIPPEIGERSIWALIRTIPVGNVKIFSKENKIELSHDSIRIVFQAYSSFQHIIFSKKIDAYYLPKHISLHFEIKEIFFNKNIPSRLFNPVIPPGFQIVRYQVPTL